MNRHIIRFITACCLGLISIGLGCQPAANNNGDNHGHSHDLSLTPKSLPAAITELKEMWEQIHAAMEANDPDSAHQPLHEVGHLLQAVPDLAADTDLSESDWEEIKKQADQIFEAFGDLDSEFHKDGDKQAAYNAAKSTIEEGIAALEAKLPLLGDSSSKLPHKDDHHHEEEHADHK